MLKKVLFISLFLSSFFVAGNVAYGEEGSETKCDVCGYEIVVKKLKDTPSHVYTPLSMYYKEEPNYSNADPLFVQKEVRKVFSNLEKEGIDSRQLFGGVKFPIYATDSSFGNYAGFTLWYGYNDYRNSIVLEGTDKGTNNSDGFKQTIAHEIGHMIYNYYFDSKAREEYRKIRKIPQEWNDNLEWEKRPMEVFAEDFALLFGELVNYVNKTNMITLTDSEKKEVKELIVKQMKLKQNETKTENKNQEILLRLRELGIIPQDDFLLCEIDHYENQPITNKEFIDWMFRMVLYNNKFSTFEDLKKLNKLYESVMEFYTDEKANKEDILSILGGFSVYIDVAKAKTWDVVGFVGSEYEEIGKGQASLIVYNFVNDNK